MTSCLNESFQKLFEYVKEKNYEGNDLFDGLNSNLFKNTFLYKSRFFRLCLIQFCKLSPINFRKIFLTKSGFNPKAGALFLMGNIRMYKHTGEEKYKNEALKLYNKLINNLIKREKGIAWGYNFDWQARAFFVPVGTPNTVTSVYVGKALIEYYKVFNYNEALDFAKQIAEFLINEMIIKEDNYSICFGYIPNESAEVHNANLLVASFLNDINKFINSDEIKNKIEKSINFSVADIDKDGYWPYGTKSFHRWMDNFHTAFNIESLLNIQESFVNSDLNNVIKKVTNYYLENLFTNEGIPKYYNNKTFPIDIHVIAESIIVLEKIKKSKIFVNSNKLEIINTKVLDFAKSFQAEEGYFYFRKNKLFWNKIPYIRWAQAWMFYALSYLISEEI